VSCVCSFACTTILGIGDPSVAGDGGLVAADFRDAGAPADDSGLVAPMMPGPLDGGAPNAGNDAAGGCTITATQSLIDDMNAATGTSIAFSPPACAWSGGWYDWADTGGVIANPPGAPTNPAPPMTFSPLPSGFPAEAGNGGDSEPKAACIIGATGRAADITAGMGLYFGIAQEPDGGNGPQLQVNASSYTGIQFWTWGGSDAGLQAVSVDIADKNETAGFGVCDPTDGGATACSGATETITIGQGWQLVQAPFALLKDNVYYGGGNEMMLDPSSLTHINWSVHLGADGGAPMAFNFCVYDVAFF